MTRILDKCPNEKMPGSVDHVGFQISHAVKSC